MHRQVGGWGAATCADPDFERVQAAALRRATEAASARNMLSCIDFQRHDLNKSFPEGTFDLVSAQYLHSPARLDRDGVLRRATERVNRGGVLLIVDHGAPPPWAEHHDHHFAGIEEVLGSLRLDAPRWTRLRTEAIDREMVGPNGEVGTMADNVMVLRRTGKARLTPRRERSAPSHSARRSGRPIRRGAPAPRTNPGPRAPAVPGW